MQIRSFGKLSDGRAAGLYILSNRNGMEAHLTDYGATLVRLIVPDKDDKFRDVVLGYDDVTGYEKGGASIGATVGRVANRISDAAFDLNGRHYILTANNGPNCLHGGRDFYVHRMWSPVISFGKVSSADIGSSFAVESMNDWSRENRGSDRREINRIDAAAAEIGIPATETAEKAPAGDSITFALDSPDGDQGFPGDIHIEVTYTLTDNNELHLDYRAAFNKKEEHNLFRNDAESISDAFASARTWIAVDPDGDKSGADKDGDALATPLNLTNHSYFNLNGHDSGSVLRQIVQINAEQFTEADRRSIPTGTLLDVKWTPMDFRKPKAIGEEIDNDYEQLRFGGGYDHNYVLANGLDNTDDSGNWRSDGVREAASMYSEESGIKMTVLTDLPGIQLYTANGLDNEMGKDFAVYQKRSAACFETQFWPDTINKKNFPGGILREGETFTSRTTYKFNIEE